MSEVKGKTPAEIILAGLIVKPCRLEAFDLRDSMFDGQARDGFRLICKEWEDRRPDRIDPELIKAAGHDGIGEYLAGLRGYEPIGDEGFKIYYRRFRESQLKKSLVRKLETWIKSPEGIESEDIRPEMEELGRIKQSGASDPVKSAFIGTLADFIKTDIPEAESLIDGLVRREEFLYVGGVKHSHKTTLLMDMGLHFAAGKSPWLNFTIPKPGRILMVQQELGQHEFRKRLLKAIKGGGFDNGVLDRFIPYTGTGDPIKLMTEDGVQRLEELIKNHLPLDILALDPQASFCVGRENDDVAQAKLRDVINFFKVNYKIGVALSHHFSSKRPAGDPTAPDELAGWFRGHSILSDAADAQIGLHRLPGQRKNPNLPRPYEDYNQVEVNLRNGKWPPKFAIEFIEESFLMKLSNIWHEAGFRIAVGDVRLVCDMKGGQILLADLIAHYNATIGPISDPAVKSAVKRDEAAGLVTTERTKGTKGSPILIKSKEIKK